MNILKSSKIKILLAFIALSFITSNCPKNKPIIQKIAEILNDDKPKDSKSEEDSENNKLLNVSKDKKNDAIAKKNETDTEKNANASENQRNLDLSKTQKNIAQNKKNNIRSSLSFNNIDNVMQADQQITLIKNTLNEVQTAATASRNAADSISNGSPLRTTANDYATEAQTYATEAQTIFTDTIQFIGNEGDEEIRISKYKNVTFTKIVKIINSIDSSKGSYGNNNTPFHDATFEKSLILPTFSTKKKLPNNIFAKVTFEGKIIFPNDLDIIGASAFRKAILPAGFKLPNSITEIDHHAFSEVVLPAGFKLPNSLDTIGANAFNNATLPVGFKISSSVLSIGTNAFLNALLPEDHKWSGNLTDDSNYTPVKGDEIVAKTP